MKKLTNGVINGHVDSKDKEEATIILKNLHLNLTIKQGVKRKAVPFEASNSPYSEQLEKALKESRTIEKKYMAGKRTGCNNVDEMVRTVLN